MLRLVQSGSNLPIAFIKDPAAEFQPGMLGQLTVIGNQIMCTVSNGTAPIGIIDDICTKAFTAVSWNEVITIAAAGVVDPNTGQLVLPYDLKAELKNAYIDKNSFLSTVDVILTPPNGVITFLAGTPLNFDLTGQGYPNAMRTVVNYTYQVPNIPGDDSTIGSGRMTIWFARGFFQTDQFETSQIYPVNANLYCNEHGLFTTRRPSPIHPAIAIVSAPPTPLNGMLELMWL